MKPIAFGDSEPVTGRPFRRQLPLSRRALGAVGLGSGLLGLVAVEVGAGSWIVLGTAFVAWSFAGWQLFFADSRNHQTVRILGKIFLSTGLLVAAAILLKIYLIALGPAWVL
jgi:hypothetical protein